MIISLILFSAAFLETGKWIELARDNLFRFKQRLGEVQWERPVPDLQNREIASPNPDIEELRNYMLELINADRRYHGLAPVGLGQNVAAQLHAADQLKNGYSSHWGMDGLTPYMRYTLAGGVNYEAENSSGPGFIEDGVRYMERPPHKMLEESQAGLMNSPGHRRNILNKWHKNVNLGIACNRYTCSVVQQFEGDYVDFKQEPAISTGILSFAGSFKEKFVFEGVQLSYDEPPHPLTLGQLDATYSYLTGQVPATFLREPLGRGYHYSNSSTTFTWESGVDPYLVDPNTPRSGTPPPQNMTTRFAVVPWTTAQVWEVSGQSFRVEVDLSSIIDEQGPGVYTILIWGNSQREFVPLTNYSIFLN